jgi:hypothetical protein
MPRAQIEQWVKKAVWAQPVSDTHTHTCPPPFGASPHPGGLLLWGVDELVTYHYLIAEVFRAVPATRFPYEKYWAMSRAEQADHIWKHLFVERTPISEACRGVLTALQMLGLDPNEKSLTKYRKWFAKQTPDKYIDTVMRTANVDLITMTNPIFDDQERGIWERVPKAGADPRFAAVLRIDPLLRDWPGACAKLSSWGYGARPDFSGKTVDEVKRFLAHWLDTMRAVYVAMSLPPEFRYPDPQNPAGNRFIRECLMPILAEKGKPWAMMIGARLRVNPGLREGGDAMGAADVLSVINLCQEFPQNKFMVTMLARENQHELATAGRKFGNLLPFGCWWFLNNPSLVEEITRMRIELLGSMFVPQHSDARVLDQLLYKWEHSRRTIAKVLVDKYVDLTLSGYKVTAKHVQKDVALLLRDNYRQFVGL